MIRSMTGFASVAREEAGDRVAVTLKSVNHRFLDVQVKAPSALAVLESRVKSLVQQRLTRGRVEVQISIDRTATPSRDVVVDEALVERVALAVEAARARGLVEGGLTASDLLRIPQAIDIRPRDEAADHEGFDRLVERTVEDAVEALAGMRETEGRFLAADLSARATIVSGYIDELDRLAREGQRNLEARLRERLDALPADVTSDPAALAQEVVRFVARSDVDEEVVRMRGHVGHWRALAEGVEPCGRKLEFLLQEMNREVNTIGSKVEGAKATETVIAAKAELERLREQVQNVE